MDRRCWMLVLSFALSVPSIIGFACNRHDDAAAKAALTHARKGDAAFDAIIDSGTSPELRKFAEQAKADAERSNMAGEFAAEAAK
ncbi:hypothetical protein EON77_12235 [bacterium]|nr:MAG: hypothetical protein EON77_12235 [bacterium]